MCVQFGPATTRTSLLVSGLAVAMLTVSAPAQAQRLTTSFIGHGSPGGDYVIQRQATIGGDRAIGPSVIGGDVAMRREEVIGGDIVLGPRTDFDTGLNIRFALQPAPHAATRAPYR